ncbi:AraC family transcriptional regulator [Marinobacterium rhizophilum]|uniref:AraC family transcriptional regulator n=1 Tax=Marinobacterium rhizophilum TaxID=420402 RepID=A0ABY5HKY8_9GAMM|nr:AraC family transcriptional regulator [Marinobacterium rhizophilum]UTW12789.1 AraC family transcriptional regulator [Marinobacterium rhizophilum]
MDNRSPAFPQANDPLGEILHQLRLDGSLYCRSELSGAWSLAMPVLPGKMMFHIITAGHCWLQLDGEPPIRLSEGALVLIPHGHGHIISSDPQLPAVPLFEAGVRQISERYEVLEIAGAGEKTELTCGVMCFDQFAGKQLVQQLPSVLLLEQLDASRERWLSSTLDFIAAEARQLKPGGETIITHLADILVIQLIRHWMEQSPDASTGWVGALQDKHIGIALRAIHHQPEKNWTLDSLARECGMSRSGFSAHFRQMVGNSVKNYLTQWRMNLAYQRLKHRHEPLITLAEDLGYASEAAFSRAFKRVMGVSPGKV